MAMLVHVTGDGRELLPPFDGHLVRNLEWERFTPDAIDAGVDALVLSPDSPDRGHALVAEVREAGFDRLIVVIPTDGPGWTKAIDDPQVAVVSPDRAGLPERIAKLDPGSAPPVLATIDPDPPNSVIDLRRHVPKGGGRGLLRERLGDGSRSIGESMRDFDRTLVRETADRSTDNGSGPAGTRQVHHPVQTTAAGDAVPIHLSSVATPVSPATSAPTGPPAPQSRRSRRDLTDPDILVPALLQVADRLYGVRETGTAVAAHVHETVGVDAVAVLIPDGSVWSVAGAVGHRHLEERLTLSSDHWLIAEVASAHHGVVVEDTDIARTRLAGAPLAAWPHLMACPLPEVGGIVILARSELGPPFVSRDLGQASRALNEADDLFAAAVQVRELARRLRTLAELDDLA